MLTGKKNKYIYIHICFVKAAWVCLNMKKKHQSASKRMGKRMTGCGLELFLFFHMLGIIIPTDFHIFQRGRYTTNQ